MTGNALIVGYGNPLRGDDGVGQAVARAFAGEAAIDGVDALACHQLTPELAERFAAAARVVLIDAAAGREAGGVSVVPLQPAPAPVLDPRPPCRAVAVAAHGAGSLRPIARGLSGDGGGGFPGARRGAVGAGRGGAARGHRDGAPIGAEAPVGRVTGSRPTHRRARVRSSRPESRDQTTEAADAETAAAVGDPSGRDAPTRCGAVSCAAGRPPRPRRSRAGCPADTGRPRGSSSSGTDRRRAPPPTRD